MAPLYILAQSRNDRSSGIEAEAKTIPPQFSTSGRGNHLIRPITGPVCLFLLYHTVALANLGQPCSFHRLLAQSLITVDPVSAPILRFALQYINSCTLTLYGNVSLHTAADI